mgnify:CR=1 FL=1
MIKKQICRYCMYQRLKLKKGEIEKMRYLSSFCRILRAYSFLLSRYCPLDLFSGDATRIERSMLDVFDVPQNNLKVYKDGKLCYTGLLVRNIRERYIYCCA